MNTSYPPRRRFERSRTDRMLGGVCGGAARYLNMDATLVRILTVVLSVVFPVTIAAYIVLLFVLPEQDLNPGPAAQVRPAEHDPVWGSTGAPWQQQNGEPTGQPYRQPAEPRADVRIASCAPLAHAHCPCRRRHHSMHNLEDCTPS